MRDVVSVAEAAQILDLSVQRVYELVAAGTLPRVRDGRRVFISAGAVRGLAAARKHPEVARISWLRREAASRRWERAR